MRDLIELPSDMPIRYIFHEAEKRVRGKKIKERHEVLIGSCVDEWLLFGKCNKCGLIFVYKKKI